MVKSHFNGQQRLVSIYCQLEGLEEHFQIQWGQAYSYLFNKRGGLNERIGWKIHPTSSAEYCLVERNFNMLHGNQRLGCDLFLKIISGYKQPFIRDLRVNCKRNLILRVVRHQKLIGDKSPLSPNIPPGRAGLDGWD